MIDYISKLNACSIAHPKSADMAERARHDRWMLSAIIHAPSQHWQSDNSAARLPRSMWHIGVPSTVRDNVYSRSAPGVWEFGKSGSHEKHRANLHPALSRNTRRDKLATGTWTQWKTIHMHVVKNSLTRNIVIVCILSWVETSRHKSASVTWTQRTLHVVSRKTSW